MAGPADLLEANGIGDDFLDHVIVICRLVMKQHKALNLRRLGELDRNDIARMTPILLDRDCVGELVHRIKNQYIGVSVECDKRVRLVEVRIFVLAISRVDHSFVAA